MATSGFYARLVSLREVVRPSRSSPRATRTREDHMKAAVLTLALVLGLTACGGRAKPASRPAPAAAKATSGLAAAARDTVRMPDAIAPVVIAIPDSVLTRQAV